MGIYLELGLLPLVFELGQEGLLLDIYISVDPLPLVEEVVYIIICKSLGLDSEWEEVLRPEFGEHLFLEIAGRGRDNLFVVVQVGTQNGVGRGHPL